MIINLKFKMAKIPIQFLLRLHFFPLLSKIDTDAILYKVKGKINCLALGYYLHLQMFGCKLPIQKQRQRTSTYQ